MVGVTLLLSVAVAAMNVRLPAKHRDAHADDDNGAGPDDDGTPPAGSYGQVIATGRAFTRRRRACEAARGRCRPAEGRLTPTSQTAVGMLVVDAPRPAHPPGARDAVLTF